MKSEIARQILAETPIDVRKELSEHWELVILQSNPMKLNIEQLEDILHITKQTQEVFKKLRFGQCIWNAIQRGWEAGINPYEEIVNQYHLTIYDPFYTDAVVISWFELILNDTAAQYWYETKEFKDLVDGINKSK